MNHRSTILLAIPHLDGGGAERVFAVLASHLSARKYDIHLAVVTASSLPLNRFPANITTHAISAPRVRNAAMPLLRLVRRIKPNIILSGMYHLNFLVLLLRLFFPRRTKILVRQNGIASSALESCQSPIYSRLLYRMLYPHADHVICQSPTMANDLAEHFRIPASRLAVLYNPVDIDATLRSVGESPIVWPGNGPHLVSVGRLSKEKGFNLLLDALVVVREKFPATNLVIAGSGPEHADLIRQCSQLGLEAVVRFVGYVDQPAQYFAGSSAFVLSSLHEGMPNALLEAASSGLPVVALPAAGGIADLLRGQPGAWVAPEISSSALAATLIDALSSIAPGQRFTHEFLRPFQLEQSIPAFEELIDAVLSENPCRSSGSGSRP